MVVGAEAGVPAVQALVRWDPAGFAARELAERSRARLPARHPDGALTGSAGAVAELLAAARCRPTAEMIGPVPVDGDTERMLVRVARPQGAELARALQDAAAGRSAARRPSRCGSPRPGLELR